MYSPGSTAATEWVPCTRDCCHLYTWRVHMDELLTCGVKSQKAEDEAKSILTFEREISKTSQYVHIVV